MDCSTPGFPVLHHQLQFMSIESVMPSNHLIICHPLLPPSVIPSIRVFSNESGLRIRWPKYWSFSFSISPSNECSGLISFRIDWFELLAVQRTLKSLFQHHNLKYVFFGTQPSLWPGSHIHVWPEKQLWLYRPSLAQGCPSGITVFVLLCLASFTQRCPPGHLSCNAYQNPIPLFWPYWVACGILGPRPGKSHHSFLLMSNSSSLELILHWRRKWQPTPVFLPGKSHGWRTLVGYRPQGRKESDTTEETSLH